VSFYDLLLNPKMLENLSSVKSTNGFDRVFLKKIFVLFDFILPVF